MTPKKQPLPTKKTEFNYSRDFFLAVVSNKSKFFSQKKIFTLVVFIAMLIINMIYLAKNIHKIEPLELVEITGLWLAYGGYNSFQNYRDRKLHKDDPSASESADTSAVDEIIEEVR